MGEDAHTPAPQRLIAEPEHSFLFLSSLLGKPVIDAHGTLVGRLSDLAVSIASTFPPVVGFVVKRGHWDPLALTGRWASVADIGSASIRLGVGIQALTPSKLEESGEILLREVLMDKQIVDMSGAKVVRVNDLHFLKLGSCDLRLIHVDVGTRGLVRRMGWETLIDGLTRRLRPHASYLTAERLIQWQYVQPMSLDDRAHSVRLSVMQKQLAELHPADIAEILTDLDLHERATVFRALDAETAADALAEVDDPRIQSQLLETVSPDHAADILEEMQPDEAADLLGELPQETSSALLHKMEVDEADDVRELLTFAPDTAGGMMTTDFVAVSVELTVEDAFARLRALAPEVEAIYYVFVVDGEGRLVGVLNLRQLIMAQPEVQVSDVMIEDPARVHHTDSRDTVAQIVEKYDLLALPVVDDGDILMGMITVDDVVNHIAKTGVETEAGAVSPEGGLRRRLRARLETRAPVLPFYRRLRARLKALMPARVVLVLSIIGPGVITANVDNDAGGIATYSLAGANFGYGLFWVLIPVTVALIVVQEMCSRMGIVTGKGLADLIREQYGVKATFYVMVALLLANLANTVAEFAGVAAALEIFGVTKYLSVPLAALFVWWLIVYGTYRRVERVFLLACFFYVAYLVSGVLAEPPWGRMLTRMVVPEVQWNSSYLVMLVGVVGTTIAPWMQFYQQSAVVEKGIRVSEYRYARYDTMVGCFIAVIVAMFIMVACAATLHEKGIVIESAKDAALALEPLAGRYCAGLFAFGLFNASLFAASVLPLATAYYVCEGLGWETGIDRKFREAPQFFGLYTALIVLGSLFILIPGFPLLGVMYVSQVLNGVLLPFVLIFILLLINRRDLMGQYVNTPLFNVVAWSTSVVMIVLTAVMVGSLVLGY